MNAIFDGPVKAMSRVETVGGDDDCNRKARGVPSDEGEGAGASCGVEDERARCEVAGAVAPVTEPLRMWGCEARLLVDLDGESHDVSHLVMLNVNAAKWEIAVDTLLHELTIERRARERSRDKTQA